METIFGIPMTAFMIVLLILLGLCLLAVGWVAWRRPVIFKLGVRNIPRRRAQTSLIVVGLMLSTLIVSAALGTGDTLDYSITAAAYDILGNVDEVVVYSQEPDGNADTSLSTKIDASALTVVEDALRDDARVSGVMPILFEGVPAVNLTQGQSEPHVTLSGVDPTRLDSFGGLIGVDGQPIDLGAIPAGSVVLSEMAAEKLVARPGDSLMLYYANQPLTLQVAAIAEDSILSGVLGSGRLGMVVPLARMQEVTGQTGVFSLIAVANTGGVRGGLEHSDGVTETLKAALTGQQLGVDPIKQRVVDDAEMVGTIFTDIFLLMGLFSIAAGILLIVLIFAMLAAERRGEMGMERAVGTQRRQLIQQFVAEGTGYTIVAGLIGAGLGLLAAIGIALAMKGLFGGDLAITPHVEPRSLIVAYSLGVVITFGAVVIASWRISRLNIVAAVRDLPEVNSPRRKRRTLVWGGLLLVVGTMIAVSGVSADQAFPFYTGLSLIPFGIALVLRYFGVRSRPVFTGVALFLLLMWLAPSSLVDPILGEYEQGMEMFFTSGIFLVLGTTLLIVQNTDVLLAGVSKVAGLFRSSLPAVRTAIAYPGAAIGRTGLTIAMFSLIVFSLVMMATMNDNFSNLILGDDAAAGWDVRADQGQANPIADFPAALKQNGVDTSGITGYGDVTVPDPAARIRLPGDEWKETLVHGMDGDFIAQSTLMFQQRARGYETDEAIIQALLTQPGVAIVDSSAVPNPGSLGADADLFQLEGVKWEDEVFERDDDRGDRPAQHDTGDVDDHRRHRHQDRQSLRSLREPGHGRHHLPDDDAHLPLHEAGRQHPGGDRRPGNRAGAVEQRRPGRLDPRGDGGRPGAGSRHPLPDGRVHGARSDRRRRRGRRDRLPDGGGAPAADRRAASDRLSTQARLAQLHDRNRVHRRCRGHRRHGARHRPGVQRLHQRSVGVVDGLLRHSLGHRRRHRGRDGCRRRGDGLDPRPVGGTDRAGRGAAVRIEHRTSTRAGVCHGRRRPRHASWCPLGNAPVVWTSPLHGMRRVCNTAPLETVALVTPQPLRSSQTHDRRPSVQVRHDGRRMNRDSDEHARGEGNRTDRPHWICRRAPARDGGGTHSGMGSRTAFRQPDSHPGTVSWLTPTRSIFGPAPVCPPPSSMSSTAVPP